MVRLRGKVDFNQIRMGEKFEAEVERLRKFQRIFMGGADIESEDDIDLCAYAKYLLKEGALTEKRELLLCLKSKFVLTGKDLAIES